MGRVPFRAHFVGAGCHPTDSHRISGEPWDNSTLGQHFSECDPWSWSPQGHFRGPGDQTLFIVMLRCHLPLSTVLTFTLMFQTSWWVKLLSHWHESGQWHQTMLVVTVFFTLCSHSKKEEWPWWSSEKSSVWGNKRNVEGTPAARQTRGGSPGKLLAVGLSCERD